MAVTVVAGAARWGASASSASGYNGYTGSVEADVDQTGYCDGQVPTPVRGMTVAISGLDSTVTDSAGHFAVPGTGGERAISLRFDGPAVNVDDFEFGDSIFEGLIEEEVPFAITWTDATPSRRAERDCFTWVNETRALVQRTDPDWDLPKHLANVNVDGSCGASWSTSFIMNFFRQGNGCANTAIMGDVVAHEYGHGIQHSLLGGQGGQGLGEGNADLAATFISDDSIIARGFFLDQCGAGIRDCANALRYPEDVVGQPNHAAGRVICGFHWDARRLLEQKLGPEAGKVYAARLWHFARKLWLPDTQPEQVLATFVVDDDDGDLGNGTPNHDELCEAAENHGFPCPGPEPGGVVETAAGPAGALVHSSRPNPIQPRAEIHVALPAAGWLRIGVFDAAGREVALLADGPREAGGQVAVWDGTGNGGEEAPAGVYFYRLEAGGLTASGRMILVR